MRIAVVAMAIFLIIIASSCRIISPDAERIIRPDTEVGNRGDGSRLIHVKETFTRW